MATVTLPTSTNANRRSNAALSLVSRLVVAANPPGRSCKLNTFSIFYQINFLIIFISQEQITLWGGLFAILLAIASIVYCRKNDLNVPACVALKRSAIRLCCGGGSSGDHHLNEGEGGGHGEEDTEMALKQHSRRGEATGASHGWRNNTVNPLVIEMSHV